MCFGSLNFSMLGKVFQKKRYNLLTNDYSLCTFKKTPSLSILTVIKQVVLLLSEMHLAGALSALGHFFKDEIFWISDRSIFEMVMVFYYRKTMKVTSFFAFL